MSKYRNGCIAMVGAVAASGAHAAEGGGLAAAAAAAMDAALADVTMTGPKVLMVVAAVVSVGILIVLVRKA